MKEYGRISFGLWCLYGRLLRLGWARNFWREGWRCRNCRKWRRWSGGCGRRCWDGRLRRVEVLDPSLGARLSGRGTGAARPRGDGRRGGASREVGRREPGRTKGIIVIQPRMTGGFWLTEPDRPDHIRLVFHVDKPRAMVWYCDTRRLGKIGWYRDAEEAAGRLPARTGPMPWRSVARAGGTARTNAPRDQADPDGPESGRGNRQYLRRRDPARVANPPRAGAGTLSLAELERLHRAIGEVLATAIELEGSSFDAGYRTVLGLEGGFLAQNSVYGRAGPALPGVRRPIVKTKIAGLIGRPTYYCPACQKRA